MTITFLAPDGVELSATRFRQAHAALYGGGSGRPLGGRSGFRVGTAADTLTATSTTWTLKPCAAQIDPGFATAQGMYGWASDMNVTGGVTAADATNGRKDIVYIQINDSTAGDGSGAVSADVKYLAGTPSTSPVAPTLPARSFLVGAITVPVAGGGSPTVVLNPARFVTAGGVLPVADKAERDGLTVFDGLAVRRMDLPGRPAFTWDTALNIWCAPALGFLGDVTNNGATATGTSQSALLSKSVSLEANRRIEIRAFVTAKPDTADLYGEYQIYAGGIGLKTFVKRFTSVELGESFEFTAAHGSGAGGSTEFSLHGRVVSPAVTTALIKSDAFALKLTVSDAGTV